MCGIVGYVSAHGDQPPRRHLVETAVSALTHRGPDGTGFYHSDCVSLGHTRLSIIDLADGIQPMANEDRSVWTIYNGEIWNYRAVRERLESAGHVFATRCDTEVIVHGYEEWGEELPSHLDGMFALAVWDEARQRLLLARDRMGKKPLYIRRSVNGLAFGSDARSVLIAAGEAPGVARERVAEFLFQRYVNSPHTMFAGVEKLPPATTAVYDRHSMRSNAYWELERDVPNEMVNPKRLRAMLRDAVEKRLMSDVPLGVFLSGGIDSAAVLGLMRELGLEGVAAFTIGFEDPVFDERSAARATAELHRADWHSVVVGPNDFIDALPRLSWYRDEPMAEPSEIPLLLLSEFASEHVTVVLSGEGGDELFGGYPKYRAERLLGLGGVVATALRIAAKARARTPSHRAFDRAGETMGITDPLLRWASWFRTFNAEEVGAFVAADSRTTNEMLTDALAARLLPYAGLDQGRQMLVGDLLTYLPENLLLRADKVTMAASLEGRMPLLDRTVVETIHRLPFGRRAGLRSSKSILRQAVADLVPAGSLHQAKRGFPVPVGRLVAEHGRLPQCLLLSDRCLERGLLQPDAVRRLVNDSDYTTARDLKLFTLCALELWLRSNVDELRLTPPQRLEELLDRDSEPVRAA